MWTFIEKQQPLCSEGQYRMTSAAAAHAQCHSTCWYGSVGRFAAPSIYTTEFLIPSKHRLVAFTVLSNTVNGNFILFVVQPKTMVLSLAVLFYVDPTVSRFGNPDSSTSKIYPVCLPFPLFDGHSTVAQAIIMPDPN